MAGRVIQGFFVGGNMRPMPGIVQAKAASTGIGARAGRPGPPPPAHAAGGGQVQMRPAQAFGGKESFAVDPVQLGLSSSRGHPLPNAVLAKMEAAFNADFSNVRVHVGPQAARIGAIAFTTGNDLYFAPGRYQPDSVQGQQLIGHELAHVIQQRQGRVRAPGNGVAVVQDRALEAEADRLGARAANHRMPAQRQPVQRKAAKPGTTAPTFRRTAQPAALQRARAIIQRCMEMEHTGNLDYNGDLIGRDLTDPDVVALLDDLEQNNGYTTSMLGLVKAVIEADPVFVFDNPTHLKNFSKNPQAHPPSMAFDDDAAELVDTLAGEFGSAFKGPKIAFSGSRVYAVAYSEGEHSLWAMLNSSTGHIGKKEQSVVKTWTPETIPYSFPSNTLKLLNSAKLKRPKVMPGNAHAEVNEILHHSIRAIAALHKTPHDVKLMFGSDIKHCAECYWAAHAVWKKAGTLVNKTGCGNRLFARWREPWDGFYLEYGDNPFRKSNGDFRTGFATGEYTATKLNSMVSGTVGNIYI